MDTSADGQGEGARRRFPELPPPEPPRSAGMLVWGILALVIGQVLYQAGQQQAVVEAVSGVSEGDGAVLTFFGVALSLVGLVWLLIGVHRLASGVDRLVRASAGALEPAAARTE